MIEEDKSEIGQDFYKHKKREDGTRDLYFGKNGEEEHGHAVIDEKGNLKFLRESDGDITADDKIRDE